MAVFPTKTAAWQLNNRTEVAWTYSLEFVYIFKHYGNSIVVLKVFVLYIVADTLNVCVSQIHGRTTGV